LVRVSRRTGIVSISLQAVCADGTSRKVILGGLAKLDEARYLEQALSPLVDTASEASLG
jgi:hypothetical protein